MLDFWNEIRGRRTDPPPAQYSPRLPDRDAPETEADDTADPPAWQPQSITGRTYVIAYSDSKQQISERQVLCRRLEQNAGTLYLHAFCYVRERPRVFRGDRINMMIDSETGEVFQPGSLHLEQFLPEATSDAPYRYGLSPQHFANLNAALNVLAFIARCDGEWHPLEAGSIEDFASSYWLRAEIPSSLDTSQVLRHAARLAPDAEAFWVSLQRCAEHPLLSKIIRRHISNVIDADGFHHPREIYWGRQVDEFLSG